MSPRPLVFLSGLTAADYLLWNWSLNTNHDVLALISGLTLPPLLVVWLWTLAVGLGRLISSRTRRRRAQAPPPVAETVAGAEQVAPASPPRKIAA